MASYPKNRPQFPFPYFSEVMTGFEYTAAIGMLYEGQIKNGLTCIQNIRARYDGRKRSPFDEAECGHHYARAMISWAAILALSGFEYSGVEHSMTFAANEGVYFWSNGDAWGRCQIAKLNNQMTVTLSVLNGQLSLTKFILKDYGKKDFKKHVSINSGEEIQVSF
jgi:non-lysosomal glucosylceramidase